MPPTIAEHACPRAILDLVERFDLHRETYRRDAYNETQVRREFIDPLFAALGWKVDNTAGHAEACKDAIHEDAMKVRTVGWIVGVASVASAEVVAQNARSRQGKRMNRFGGAEE